MKAKTKSEILDLFKENFGYAKTEDIKSRGFHHRLLSELEENGSIYKVKHGLYALSDNEHFNSLFESSLIIPNGIICMGSALSYYGLTTWDPIETHIAIPRGSKILVPENLPIKLFHFSGEYFKTGAIEVRLESGQTIKMYDIEKTICDIIRFRNRIGIDIMKESLNEYIKLQEINLNKLNKYADHLKIKSVLNQYLDVLL